MTTAIAIAIGAGAAQVVREAVSSQVAVAPKDLAAAAVIWLDVGVREEVSLQVRALVEAPAANRTLVRRLLHVQDLVHGQRARLAEALAALDAFKWFLFGMDISVN
jgi:hypothetical protein